MFNEQNPQQDPSNSPTGDSDLISYLQAQGAQSAAPQVAAPAVQDPMEVLRKKLAEEASRFPSGDSSSILRQKLGLEDATGAPIKRGKLGGIGNAAGNILQILAGRNFTNEAAKDYQEKLQGMKQGESLLKNEDLNDYRTQMQQTLAEKNKQIADAKAAHELTLKEVQASKDKTAAEANAIKKLRVLSQNTTDAGKAATAKAIADFQLEHPNRNQASIVAELATNDDGSIDPAKFLQMSAYLKQAGMSIGTSGTSSTFQDSNGNFGTKTERRKLFGDTAIPTGLQRVLNLPGTPSPVTPGFAGPGAPVGGGNPTPKSIIPAVPPTSTPPAGVSLEFDPTKFKNPTALSAYANDKVGYQGEQKRQNKEAADAGILHNKLRYSAASTESQTNSLAKAYVAGDNSFQGPIANLFQGVRDYFGGVSPEEANQRIQDFRGLYDNLSSSVKGAYRTVEIKDAHLVQGHTGMDPESTLALHAVNTLAQQKRMLIVGKALNGTGVTTKELDDIAVATANKYLKEAKTLREKSKNLPPALKANLQAPTLMPLDEAVNQYITKKKMGLVKADTPATSPASSPRRNKVLDLIAQEPNE